MFVFLVILEIVLFFKKKRKVKFMFLFFVVVDSKLKIVIWEECIELVKMIYGRVLNCK